MKLYNAKLGRVIDATPIMFESLAIKGWVIVPEDEPQTAINDEVEAEDEPQFEAEEIALIESQEEEQTPKADPVKKVKAKSKNKK